MKKLLSTFMFTGVQRRLLVLLAIALLPPFGFVISAILKDQDEKLALIFNEGYEAYGYFIEAKDSKANPREIESTSTSFIFSFELERQQDGSILGYPKARIEIR